MASSHSLCTHQCYGSYNARTHFNSFKNATFPLPSSFKLHHMVYDLENKFNKLADEVDRDAGISRLTLFSSCKLRADGYHYLASLFHVIGLGDEIKFSLSPSKSTDRLSTNVSGVPLDERNLIIKALNLFRKKTGIDNYFWVHLDKKVHTGAGLGSGSSNAATALWAANQFSGCVATEKDHQEWSSEIGSDIPFFFLSWSCILYSTLMRLFSFNVGGVNAEPPAFEVLPSLQRLKQRIAVAGRGQYDVIFMSGRETSPTGSSDSHSIQ
ncbi:hypothetical protein DH2020_012829 [Rehmannia glutinosa]|uniref:GHMP kinase N-terminal domain-containing protein n=1 Tax=Rehmannia glutinosa TaxID=99300 RepID=A0ABR0X415_REHGL